MSTNRHFQTFHESLSKTLESQTGFDMGQFCALVLAGQNPSLPSDVSQFAQAMAERRALGKKIKSRDVDALIEMVLDYMAHQALSGRDRVTFARQVLSRVTPTLASADLETLSASDVSGLPITDEIREEAAALLEALQ